jgi:hypothetical protein
MFTDIVESRPVQRTTELGFHQSNQRRVALLLKISGSMTGTEARDALHRATMPTNFAQ